MLNKCNVLPLVAIFRKVVPVSNLSVLSLPSTFLTKFVKNYINIKFSQFNLAIKFTAKTNCTLAEGILNINILSKPRNRNNSLYNAYTSQYDGGLPDTGENRSM